MSSIEDESRSRSGSGSGTGTKYSKKKEKKKFDMKKMAFYNPELISKRKVIINTSTSKEMYSFPTSKRFADSIQDNSQFFYNLPSSFNKRYTSFGYGDKVLFSENQSPGPGSYNHMEINNKGRYAVSTLKNTQQNKFGSSQRFKNSTIAVENPAPNSYNPESMIKGNGIIYNSRYVSKLGKTFGMKLGEVGKTIITPGPGAYKHMNINLSGKYPSSSLTNSIQNKFSNEQRFKYMQDNGNPAPNAYKPETLIKGNGIVYNSRYTTNLGKSMGWRLNELSKSVTPGPGAYEFFSDFEGFYKYGKNKKNRNDGGDEDGNKDGQGDDDNAGENNSDDNSNSNGENIKEIFGKDVDEGIEKVNIKKSKLK